MLINYTKYTGLNNQQVQTNLINFGKNEIIIDKQKKWRSFLFFIFKEPTLLFLLAIAILYLALNNKLEGFFVLFSALVTIFLDVYQDRKTNHALEELKKLSTLKVKVIRNKKQLVIDPEDIVVNDLIFLQEGDRVVADGIILQSSNLFIDESLLTGESTPVFKSQSNNLLFNGTLVITGEAILKVTQVGNQTRYGKIAKSINSQFLNSSLLKKQTTKLLKIISIIAVVSLILILFLTYWNTKNILESLLISLALAISLIPEEIPIILGIFVAFGAFKLSKQNVLVKKTSTVESLGHITTLCIDKTGTVTYNELKLESIYLKNDFVPINNFDDKDLLNLMILASQVNPYDQIDLNLHNLAKKLKISPQKIYSKWSLKKEYLFDQVLKATGFVWAKDNAQLLVIKGSAENVIKKCNLSKKEKSEINKVIMRLTSNGKRVIALATKELNKITKKSLHEINNYHFQVLLIFEDPPRKGVAKIVSSCQSSGINVRMITGDHYRTALSIAKQIGLNTNKYLLGTEIDKLNDKDLRKKIKSTFIFARTSPDQKLRLIKLLQKNKELVAMIGDGVNDAPSLKQADIGIAMGMNSSSVARETADLILLDNEFSTILKAIKGGRLIFTNIQKAIYYIVIIHMEIILTALIPPLFNWPIILTPVLIIFLELIIDPTCSLVLEGLPPEKNIMTLKPNSFKKLLPNLKGFKKLLFFGLLIFMVNFTSYIVFWNLFNATLARTVYFGLLFWTNSFLILSFTNKHKPFWHDLNFLNNKTFFIIYALILIIFISAIYIKPLNTFFNFTYLPFWILFLIIPISFLPIFIFELKKEKRINLF